MLYTPHTAVPLLASSSAYQEGTKNGQKKRPKPSYWKLMLKMSTHEELRAVVGPDVSQEGLQTLLDAADGDVNRAVNYFFNGLLDTGNISNTLAEEYEPAATEAPKRKRGGFMSTTRNKKSKRSAQNEGNIHINHSYIYCCVKRRRMLGAALRYLCKILQGV